MNLKLENIGMIRHADIKLDGLTIIAGENDTGKSTVGKLIFSLIKAFNRYEQDFKERKFIQINDIIEKNYFQLRKEYDFEKNVHIKDAFYPSSFLTELIHYQNDPVDVIDKKIQLLKEIKALKYIENLDAIKTIYLDNESKKNLISMSLIQTLISEFDFEFSQKNSELPIKINIIESSNNIVDITIKNNKVTKLDLFDDLFFNEVTFIETPVFLQISNLIRSASTLFGLSELKNTRSFKINDSTAPRPMIAFHIKDLIEKLENAQYFSQPNLFNNLLDDIKKITKGSGFSFEKKDRDFYFNKNGIKFKSINTATGLKSFGIIQLLIQADILNERSLLIIDEPEIHLHPKWQVEYAKLIVALVKNDIPVLLTSHSPEMIQALSVFSKKFGVKNKTSYYLAESDGMVSDINDVTNDINKIFIKLAEPLHNLVWE